MKIDFIAHVPVSVPSVIYPHGEASACVYYVCNRVGSSVRVVSKCQEYSTALEKAAELSINLHRNYFVVQVESKIRVL